MASAHRTLPAQPDTAHAVEIAPRVWWVGSVLPGDAFQCHSYLVENGHDSLLIDPGSPLTFAETLRRVAEVLPLDDIRWIVCHHSDPDVAGALRLLDAVVRRDDARVVTEWRAEALLRHYGGAIPFHRVEENGWRIELDDDRALEFALTPYLHFPGAMVSFETATRTLFSSDLFGGFVIDPGRLYAEGPDHFDSIREFHQHYMPSRDLLAGGLARIRDHWERIDRIAPQHGAVITGSLVDPMFEQLSSLECGVFGDAKTDLDIGRLVMIAGVGRRAMDAFVRAESIDDLSSAARRELGALLKVTAVEAYVNLPLEGWVRLFDGLGDAGEPVEAPPAAGPRRLELLLPLDSEDDAEIRVHLLSDTDAAPDAEVADLLARVRPGMRVAVDRALAARAVLQERSHLLDTARRDPLTGMLNRRGLESLSMPESFTVIAFDIDHFKRVNDTFGHEAGDEVLTTVSDVMRATVRAEDRCVRTGGEEFLVLLPGADAGVGKTIAARIRASVGVVDLSGRAPGGRVSLSAGVAQRKTGEPLADVLARADAALYQAKEKGRNRIEVSPP